MTQEPGALRVTRQRDNNCTQYPSLAPKSCNSSPLGTVGSQLIVSGTWKGGGGGEYCRLFRLLFSACSQKAACPLEGYEVVCVSSP